MEQPNSTSPACAHCQKPATLCCSGCKDVPTYNKKGVEKTWYCSAECQKRDWVTHKSLCRTVQERKAFFRLGSLLQEMFYRYREKLFDRPVARLEEADGRLFIHETEWPRIGTSIGLLHPFPSALCTNLSHKQAILAFLACEDATGWMHDLVKHLKPDFASDISEVTIRVKNPTKEAVAVGPEGTEEVRDYAMSFNHTLWRVELKRSKEQYALDLTGAQFGFHDPVVPWDVYAESRIGQYIYKAHNPSYFGRDKTTLMNRCSEQNLNGYLSRTNRATALSFHLGVVDWETRHQLTVGAVLRLPEEAFKQMREELVQSVDTQLQICLRGLKVRDLEARRERAAGLLRR